MRKVCGLHSENSLFLLRNLTYLCYEERKYSTVFIGSAAYLNFPKSVKRFCFALQYSDCAAGWTAEMSLFAS